jgi:hypothetical protein
MGREAQSIEAHANMPAIVLGEVLRLRRRPCTCPNRRPGGADAHRGRRHRGALTQPGDLGVKVTILADRGFGDQAPYALLKEQLGFDFVVRFRGS